MYYLRFSQHENSNEFLNTTFPNTGRGIVCWASALRRAMHRMRGSVRSLVFFLSFLFLLNASKGALVGLAAVSSRAPFDVVKGLNG